MATRIKIYRHEELLSETEGTNGTSILETINAAGIFLDAPCGGQGRCGKCLVRLSPDGEEVRACRTYVEGDTNIYLPDELEMKIADNSEIGVNIPEIPEPSINALGASLGVAIDIGTTTVVAHLTDMTTGKRIATASGVNAQRPYGADVISRIQYCADNGHYTLTNLIREQISQLIQKTCIAAGARVRDIKYVSIAANTIMEHLAAGLSPVGMGIAPFAPLSLFGEELSLEEGLGSYLPAAQNAIVYFAPAISSYVGGDITAGMLAAGLEDDSGPTVYLDIGTNGEIAMKVGDKYFCCATAAGPAFEGAEISMGMAAVSGAISHVKWSNHLDITIIGDSPPRGLCGSGLLDALALLIETGAVDESGRLLDPDEFSHPISAHIGTIDDKNVFWLSRDGNGVFISASDIRKLQLAKSAIAAGIQTLLHHAGFHENQVASFVLAGGFGSYMDKDSAAKIGLFPKSFLPVAQTLGNTAGEGAAIILRSPDARNTLSTMRQRCEYIELSTSLFFNEQFIEQMMFD